ncbi:DUF1653 domain-containing protein [Pseudomonas sp. LFM046]|uniref:DUF1653 domain-containing protein n=1 Tax=Pseudomonas sp. LFM046 TaxID=1608357 RepID=UPI000A9B7ACA|nr:DUF1653 domain-containing protein [Pseudomonas sp. LFM046]
MSLQPGLYRHYKGQQYRVIGVARHSETEEELVVYQALYGEYGLWVRPLSMFTETVQVDGEQIARFALMSAESNPFPKP